MRRLLIFLVLLSTGCAERMVGVRSPALSSTVNDLYYTQVLNNLAMMHANPASMPYFSVPTQGTSTVSRTAQGFYQFITMQQAQLQGTNEISEAWQTAPTSNPDLINLLKCAYHKTMGIFDPYCEQMLHEFYHDYKTLFAEQYETAFHPGWYGVGGKHDVPKNVCYVGHCGKTYVWVMPGNMEDLSRFTLAVMDIATVNPTDKWPWQSKLAAGVSKLLMEQPKLREQYPELLQGLQQALTPPMLKMRTVPMMPYPAPPTPPR